MEQMAFILLEFDEEFEWNAGLETDPKLTQLILGLNRNTTFLSYAVLKKCT